MAQDDETTWNAPNLGNGRHLLAAFGAGVIFAIRRRISRGITVDGEPMLDGSSDKYSPAYEKKKIDGGRTPYAPSDRFVLTGEMLQSFGVTEQDSTSIEIGFTTDAAAEKAMANDERRPTFHLSREEADRIIEAALKEIE